MTETMELREVYCREMMRLAALDGRLVTVDADLMRAAGMKPFQAAYPERAFDVGVAEANMAGVAAGLSAMGFVPFIHSFAPFVTRRCFDQITISIAYAHRNVKIVGSDPGITAEVNGGTHMSFDDVNLMRAIPGSVVVEPIDEASLVSLLPQVFEHPGLVYMRLFRKPAARVYAPGAELRLGKASCLRAGSDVAILASGIMVSRALQAADALAEEGVRASVYDVHTIKPLDCAAVLEAAKSCGAIVTAENHQLIGGLASAVSECLAQAGVSVSMERVGVQDRFGEVGMLSELEEIFGLSARDVARAAREALARKA